MFALGALVLTLAADAGAPAMPACIHHRAESRYVPYGYNHIVILKNGCSRSATCVVTTDVNPERQSADVPSNATVEVATFLGAAASTFTARVACQLK